MKIPLHLVFLALFILPLPADGTHSWQDLYESALSSNPALAAKSDAVVTAEYQWKSARRSRGPSLFFESDLSYLTSPREVDLSAGSLYPGGTLAPGLTFPPLPETDVSLPLAGNEWYSFRLILEQPLFTSGKLSSQEKIYQASWGNVLLEREQEELSIKTEIITHVFSLSRLQEILGLLEQQRQTADRSVVLIKNAYESGIASYSDFLNAQVRAREISLRENQVRRQLNQVILNLRYLSGIEALTPASIHLEVLPPMKEQTDIDALMQEALASSPVLEMVRKQIEMASHNVSLVRGGSYGRPDLGLRVELDYGAGSLPFTSDEWNIQAANVTGTLAVRALLGDTGKSFADVKTAESKEAEARQHYRSLIDQIKKSLEEEIFNQALNRDNILYYRSRAEDDLSMAQQRKQSWEAGFGMEQDYLQQLLSWYSDLIYEKQEEISLAVSYFKMKALTGKLED
jgi:outer membrane protein TolC